MNKKWFVYAAYFAVAFATVIEVFFHWRDKRLSPSHIMDMVYDHASDILDDVLTDLRRHEGRDAPLPNLKRVITMESGDTLMGLLIDQGVLADHAKRALDALKKIYDPRDLKADDDIIITLDRFTAHGFPLLAMRFSPTSRDVIDVILGDDGQYTAKKTTKALHHDKRFVKGAIHGSLYGSAARYKIPRQIMIQVASVYAYAIDFQRDLHAGDTFEIYYERLTDPDSGEEQPGKLLYAKLVLSDKPMELVRYSPPYAGGRDSFYTPQGESVKRTLLATPVDSARISSGFGRRRHPVLGFTRMHKGVDFAAPVGTPVYASGDGVIVTAAYSGSYGNYVKIRHNGSLSTAYAHLHRFAKSIRKGASVRQRQVIGYVGVTGLTSGPHLHYEVLKNNQQINPKSIQSMPAADRLTGLGLDSFKRYLDDLYRQMMGPKPSAPLPAGPSVPTSGSVPAAGSSPHPPKGEPRPPTPTRMKS